MATTAYTSSYTGAQIDAAVGAVANKADKIAEVNHGTSDTTFTLTANTMHIWGTVTSLTLSLPTDSNSVLDEYMFTFTSGSTPTTLSLPSTVKWVQDIEVEANKTYQVSIINNLAGWLTNGMPSGGGGGGGGENNVIESISVNSVAQTVDANKNVNLQFKTINNESISGTGNISISGGLTPYIPLYATWDSNDEYLENLTFYDAAEAYNTYNTATSPVVFQVATGTMQGGSFVEDDHYYYCEMEYEDVNTGFGFSFYDSNEKYMAWIIFGNDILVVNSFTHNTIGGGEENVIETVKVNGSALTPDANKAVDVSVPTETTVSGWGFTKNAGTITGITMNNASKGTSGVVDLGTVITSETALSKGSTTGAGNAVTDISVSGHTITLTKGSTFLTSETSLSKGTTTGSGNAVTDLSVSGHTITLTKGTTFLTSSDTVTIYSGSTAPSSSTGSNGDIYIQTS